MRQRREHIIRHGPKLKEGDALMSLLFEQMFSIESLEKAFRHATRGVEKYSREALIFAENETENLLALRESILNGTYRFSGYYKFTIFEPKERIIHAPHFQDKIVQLTMNNHLRDIFIPRFIPESYSCLPDRGTHKAVDKVQSNLRKGRRYWGDSAYILKIDVKKFYYTIDRDILKQIYRRIIKEQDVLAMMDEITDSAAAIGPVGVPLGNTMSQLYSNMYLDRLDQACKRFWGYKLYVRYADDIIIVLPDKASAQLAKERCVAFLAERLRLTANKNKTQIFPIQQGVNAYGFKIYCTHKLLRDDSKKRIKRKIKKMPQLLKEGRITVDKCNQMLGSWSGHAKHGDSHNFKTRILEKRPYIKMEDGILKIDETKL